MPIEIRELIIRIAIDKYPQDTSLKPQEVHQLKNEIIQECTTKIMQKINKNRER